MKYSLVYLKVRLPVDVTASVTSVPKIREHFRGKTIEQSSPGIDEAVLHTSRYHQRHQCTRVKFHPRIVKICNRFSSLFSDAMLQKILQGFRTLWKKSPKKIQFFETFLRCLIPQSQKFILSRKYKNLFFLTQNFIIFPPPWIPQNFESMDRAILLILQ